MSTISINHSQVMAEVKRLRTVANELSIMRTNAQNAVSNMNAFWEGTAANAFTAENERWRRELRNIEEEIANLSTLIQRVANEIREAEQRAENAIRNA